MNQPFPVYEEAPGNPLSRDLPHSVTRTVSSAMLAPTWPWKEEFMTRYHSYLAARTSGQWSRAMRALNEARCYAIAGEQWSLESRVNELIVEAIANREARR
jgi:hypothetical protein